MKISPFKLEQYFEQYEFTARYLLSASDCDGLSLKFLTELMSDEERGLMDALTLGYTESRGLPLLRETIAAQYKTIACDDVLVLSPGEANFTFMNVALNMGDHVVCMAPAYQSLYQVAVSIGCNISFWMPDESSMTYHTDDLIKLIRPGTKAVIVNFPHNPTGFIPTLSMVERMVEIVADHGLILFSDEMYRHLNQPGDEIPALCDLYDNAISLWGLAKSFGLAGLRMGWIATRNRSIINAMRDYKDYLTICNNAVGEILAITALRNADKIIGINRSKIQENIGHFEQFQARHPDFINFTRPKAGSTALVRLHLKEPTLAYCERLVKESGIMLLPSEMFDFGERHVRIGFGRRNFPEVLAIWSDYIDGIKKPGF